MFKEVIIRNTTNLEEENVTNYVLLMDTIQHITDVNKTLTMLSNHIQDVGSEHDWTKLEYFTEFATDVSERKYTPDFKSRDWYRIHTGLERHHINAKVPDNVNLFDILENITDCIVAGKSRTGKVDYNYLVLSQSIINTAYWNTVKLIDDNVKIK